MSYADRCFYEPRCRWCPITDYTGYEGLSMLRSRSRLVWSDGIGWHPFYLLVFSNRPSFDQRISRTERSPSGKGSHPQSGGKLCSGRISPVSNKSLGEFSFVRRYGAISSKVTAPDGRDAAQSGPKVVLHEGDTLVLGLGRYVSTGCLGRKVRASSLMLAPARTYC